MSTIRTLHREGHTYDICDVRVCDGPAGEPPVIYITGPAAQGIMIPGDVLWVRYPNGRRERIVCWQNARSQNDFITTRIGWS